MGLSKFNLSGYDTPKRPDSSATEVAEYHLIDIKRTSTGKDIVLCTTDPAPKEALAEAASLGLPLFTVEEAFHVRQAVKVEPGFIDQLINIKMEFPGSVVKRFRKAVDK